MKQVSIKELTLESFRNYGTFSSFINPDRPNLGAGIVTFYRDMEILDIGPGSAVGFSVTRAQKRDYVIDALEHHSRTGETIMPLDGDVIMHVAVATRSENIPNDIPIEKIEVFRVPKFTMVTLKKGVWHCAPYTYGTDYVNIMVALPERAYANDCFFYPIPEQDQIEIITKNQ